MKFFKNRFVAKCLLFVAIFGLTPFVAQGQLVDKVDEVEATIYEYRGIYQRLEESCDAAGNLVSIALDYPALVTETEALRFAYGEMDACLSDDDLEDMYEANEELTTAFHALYQKLSDTDLSDEDRRAVESYINTFNGAQRTLDAAADDYNEQVQVFRSGTFSRFPARVIADRFDIDAPEYFAAGDSFSDASSHPLLPEPQDAPEVPDAPEAPELPDAPDLDQTIDDFVDGITDYVNQTVSDALDDAFED